MSLADGMAYEKEFGKPANVLTHCEDCPRETCLNRNPLSMCYNFEGDVRKPEVSYADAEGKVDSPTGGTKNDAGKVLANLLHQGCPLALNEAAKVMTLGAKKYGEYNWKEVQPERYLHAMYRHLNAYHIDNTSVDVDTGQSHLSHVLTNILFLVQLEQEGRASDE